MGKTVLVVDDERPIRSLIRAVLVRDNYEVLEAADGVQACEVLREHADRIGLLITDVVMPNMDGVALGRKVNADYPGIEVLYISGFSGDRTKNIPRDRLLQKPFEATALMELVRNISGRYGGKRARGSAR